MKKLEMWRVEVEDGDEKFEWSSVWCRSKSMATMTMQMMCITFKPTNSHKQR